jgi:hypothetical protein
MVALPGRSTVNWIPKGRTFVSQDGRWRVSRVFRGWILYDRGDEVCEFVSADAAMDFAEGRIEAAAS